MPTTSDALQSGWQLHRQGQFQSAEQVYRQVLAVEPQNPDAWCYLAMAAHDQERFDDALFAFGQALSLNPRQPVAYQNMGKTLGRLRRFDEAIACFDRAIALLPSYLNAYKNKARALYFQGDFARAEAVHRQALAVDANDTESHMNLGMLRLSRGDAGGWRDYEWRWKTKDGALPTLPQPLWDGSPLDGKSILLSPEQGLGDSIQFVRYASVLKQRYHCRVAFQCPRSLAALLANVPGVDEFVISGSPAPATDFFAPLLHVPAMLGHTPAAIPDIGPYVSADPALVATWRDRLAKYHGRKVGIAWRGSPKHPADRMRSIPLADFAPLAQVPGISLFSLQKGAGSEELPPLAERLKIIDLGSGLDENTGAFVETAAVLKSLDLLIACDTAIIHVAGALGVPTWIALNNSPDWRWLLGCNMTNAYPRTRLFRQPTFGDWRTVFANMAKELNSIPESPTPIPESQALKL